MEMIKVAVKRVGCEMEIVEVRKSPRNCRALYKRVLGKDIVDDIFNEKKDLYMMCTDHTLPKLVDHILFNRGRVKEIVKGNIVVIKRDEMGNEISLNAWDIKYLDKYFKDEKRLLYKGDVING